MPPICANPVEAIANSGDRIGRRNPSSSVCCGSLGLPEGSTARWYATLVLGPDRDFAIFAVTNAAGDSGRQACYQALQVLVRRHDAAEKPDGQ